MKTTRVLLLFSIAAVASASSVTFTFGTVTIGSTTIQGLSSGATNAQVQTYMDAVLTASGCTGCSVTVTGAVADQTYNGEGYVVGPGGKSLTLGTAPSTPSNLNNSNVTPNNDTLATTNTFLANTNDSSGFVSNQITMKFNNLTNNFAFNGTVGFAYEIFPDGTCPSLGSCGTNNSNLPDFEFEAGTGSAGSDPAVTSFGTNGTQYGVTPSTTGTDGSSTTGPTTSGVGTLNGKIVAPQYIGYWSNASALNGDNELDFIDWPATIGVDNLTINWSTTTPVPETSSILLLGTILAGVAARKRFRKAA